MVTPTVSRRGFLGVLVAAVVGPVLVKPPHPRGGPGPAPAPTDTATPAPSPAPSDAYGDIYGDVYGVSD